MTWVLIAIAAVLVAGCVWALLRIRKRHMMIWLPSYLKGNWAGRRERPSGDGPVHIMFCIADHFEPALGRPNLEGERRRVSQWLRRYPELSGQFRDADGRPPQHTFYFPAEDYRPEHLDRLAELVAAGYGEVEVHLHHDGDTSANTRKTLLRFKEQLRHHGLLGTGRASGDVRFGFVHGNWALDNSRPDRRWCGVNDELRVLKECGCYADFTLPSAPSPTQTRKINSIYYATDDPHKPKSHDDGEPVRVGGKATGDLMIVQGPLTVTVLGGKFGFRPRIENGNLAGGAKITARRIAAWINTRVIVSGRPEWLFVKLHTHGCDEGNWDLLFGPQMRFLHEHLRIRYNDGTHYQLHYVTTREMYNIIKAAEHGLKGNPGTYRDLEIAPPAARAATGDRRTTPSEAIR